MIGSERLKIVFILFFVLGAAVFSQDKQGTGDQDKGLKGEILDVYQSQGEVGLRNFIKERKKDITFFIIIEFEETGFKQKDEQWLKIARTLAEEKKIENISNLNEYILYASLEVGAQMGICMCLKSRERAFKCLEDLIPQVEKINHPKAQETLMILKATIYALKKDFNKMGDVFNEELNSTKDQKNPKHLGDMCAGKGAVSLTNGDYGSACEMFEKAMQFYEIAGDEKGKAIIYKLWGVLYRSVGDYTRAGNMYDKALPLLEKAGDSEGLCTVFCRKAEVYQNNGDHLKALEMYDKALHAIEKLQYNQEKAEIFLTKGNIYQKEGDRSNAREMYNQALVLFENEQDPIEKRRVYETKGLINFVNADYSNAINMYKKAAPFYTDFGHFSGEGELYKTLGEIHFLTGRYSKSLEMYDRALQIYKKLGTIEFFSPTLHRKAQALEKLGKKDQALLLFEEAIDGLEKIRRQTGLSWMKLFLMEKVYKQYEETVLFMLGNKYDDKGFKYAEAMRARMFLDQMGEGLTPLEKGLTTELKKERDHLVGKISALFRQMQETDPKDEKILLELKEDYRKVVSKFDDLLIKIRLENPLYASVNYPQPLSVQDLQKEILKEGETMVSYFISQDETYAFVISKNNFHVESLKIKEKEVNGSVERYLLALKENNANDTKRYGSLLYEKLFKPLEKYLEKSSDIIIVPAGQLETIPFESFIIDNKKPGPPVYLLEKYRLKYVQSATLLSILRKNYNGDSAAKGFIGFGDPVYDYENFKQNKPEQGRFFSREGTRRDAKENPLLTPITTLLFTNHQSPLTDSPGDEIKEIHRDRFARAGGIMDRLPQSGEEIQSIARLFEKESLATKIYLRDQAAEENARAANMKDYAYIHFSCHGLLNDDFQCLVLSQLPGSKEDGYFTLNEIMNCDYNAKLIVLSACQTGSGKMARGEGITGLTRAFMYAGSPAVAASLWDVDDAATKELMVKFYSNMLEKNLDKVEALRQAKLELLKDEKYASPLYWSAFVMYGE